MLQKYQSPILFDHAARAIRHEQARASDRGKSWLLDHTQQEINDRLTWFKEVFPACLKRGGGVPLNNEDELVACSSAIWGPYDCIISQMELHWINDIARALKLMKEWLRPEGLFMASMVGGETLIELRQCLLDAELELYGGVSPRLSPMIEASHMANLMSSLGYRDVVLDQERLTLTYDNLIALIHDLRAAGETNVHHERLRTFTRRELFPLTERIYRERFATVDKLLPVTVDLFYLHARAS